MTLGENMTRFVKCKTWIGHHRGQIHAVVSGVLVAYMLGLLALSAVSMIKLPAELQFLFLTLDASKEAQQQRTTATKPIDPSSGPVTIPVGSVTIFPELALVQKDIRDLSDKIGTLDQTVKGLEKELSQTSLFDSLIFPLLLAIVNELLRRNRPPSKVS